MAGGVLTEQAPTGKVESLAPDMPPNALEYLKTIEGWFDEMAGMTAIMSGQGESGVRAGVHANTLLRTSSPRIRDRAIQVEQQCATFGDMLLKMSQAKDARVFKPPKGMEFILNQLPDDACVTVDSHTSSPAFSGDNANLAFALAKSGAIDGEALIEMTHPPRMDSLILSYRKRQAAQQQLIQQHPELLTKGHKK